MTDGRIGDVLRVLDPPPGFRPWHGGASPTGSLRGVSEEEAAWRPAPDPVRRDRRHSEVHSTDVAAMEVADSP